MIDDDIPRIRYASDSDFDVDNESEDEDDGDDFYDSSKGRKGNMLTNSYDFSTTSGVSGISGTSGNSDFSEVRIL